MFTFNTNNYRIVSKFYPYQYRFQLIMTILTQIQCHTRKNKERNGGLSDDIDIK